MRRLGNDPKPADISRALDDLARDLDAVRSGRFKIGTNIDMRGYRITGLPTPEDATDPRIKGDDETSFAPLTSTYIVAGSVDPDLPNERLLAGSSSITLTDAGAGSTMTISATQAFFDALYQPLDAQLTSLAALAYTGNTLKLIRVNAGETAFELVSPASISAGVAATVTVADAGGDTTTFPVLAGSATGDLPMLTDAGLSYNATTNALTAAAFVGALTGNADTVTTNANLTGPITSVGNATSIASQTGTGTTFVVNTSPTIVTPTIAKLANLTTNGFVKTSGGDGTLSVDSTSSLSGSNTGDVTLAGTPDYITISGQVITRGLIDLATDVTGDLPVTDGGTGRATSTTAYGLLAAGTTATGAHQTLAAGATTEILVGGGAAALPVWTTATGTGAPVRADSATFTTGLTGTITSTTKPERAVVLKNLDTANTDAGALIRWDGQDSTPTNRVGAYFGALLTARTVGTTTHRFSWWLANASATPTEILSLTPTALHPWTAGGVDLGLIAKGFNSLFLDESGAGTQTAQIIAPTLAADIVLTTPAVTGTLATLAGTETLTNKTLTNPQMTDGDLTSGTFTVESGATLAITGTFNGPAIFAPEGGDSTQVSFLSLGKNSLSLSSAASNDNVSCDLSATGGFNRITGPTGAFTITGIVAPTGAYKDGRVLVLYNSTAHNMTISNDVTSTAANRFYTSTGADIVTAGRGSATLIYSSSDSRWIVVSSAL